MTSPGRNSPRDSPASGYKATHFGSHLRLTTQESGEHHITIPRHAALSAGTLAAILREPGEHDKIGLEDLLRLVS